MAAKLKPVQLHEQPPHTGAKHALLRSYLGAWFPIIAKFNGRVVYYDAFSGPGRYKNGEPGSPIIALDVLLNHAAQTSMASTEFLMILNEQDAACAAHLELEVAAFKQAHQPWPANVKVEVSNATFIDLTTDIVDDLDSRSVRLAPTFAFVDPVGVKATPMNVLQRLTNYPKAELLVYFAHDAVVRWSGAGIIDERLTDLFGTDEYKGAGTLSGSHRSQFLHDLYQRQLHELCRFPYIQSFAMYDDRGKRVYDLFYCTREPIGLDRMKAAMWKVAPSGDFSFRDLFVGQDVIFGTEVDTEPLQKELLQRFAGQAVTIQAIIDHVIVATPYTSSHVKKLTLAPMQRASLVTSPNQRQKNRFPDGTIVQFP
ncbi:MAG TPA: three-Cys-motif partner protein TcmP [Jatrophihabitans sp.]|uniref:three-Cys-motif partner protein TcmP n=1 Tax=Jatrophihabitans sp. TaxID=1932789 RepID=UPI002F13A7D5